MKVKKKCVYYCDFCTKKSLRSLKIHEKHCTANPDRECRLCEQLSIKEVIEKYRKHFYLREVKGRSLDEWNPSQIIPVFKKKFTLNDIKNELDYNCPNCILAIIRCLGINRYYFKGKFEYFDYKKELDEWWAISNKEARARDERETYY